MFVYNIKLDSKNIVKIAFIMISIIITLFFFYSTYRIITESVKVHEELEENEIRSTEIGMLNEKNGCSAVFLRL